MVLITDAWQARDVMIAKPNRSIEQASQDAGIGLARFRRLLRLSYLAPDIIEAIITGKHPSSMNVRQLSRVTNIPLDWTEQKRFFELA